MKNILIFTATYNEAENVFEWYNRVRKIMPSSSILVVDDSSLDGTNEILQEISKEDSLVNLHVRPRKQGLASAHLYAFKFAREKNFEALVTMDADLSHEPESIPLFAMALRDSDFVIGTRRKGGKSDNRGLRLFVSIAGNFLAEKLIPSGLSEYTTSYRIFSPKALAALEDFSAREEGYSFFMEVIDTLFLQGFSLKEIPIHFRSRHSGKSKIPRRQVFNSIRILIILMLRRRHI